MKRQLEKKRRAVKTLIGKHGIHSVGLTTDGRIAVSFENDKHLEEGMHAANELSGGQCIAIIDDSCLFRDEDDREYWDDYQGPLSVLLREGVIHPSSITDSEGKKQTGLFVICNDIFAWGCSDAEDLPRKQIGPLFDEFVASGYDGVIRWCARMRQMPPQAPVIHSMLVAGNWTSEMQDILERWRAEHPEYAWDYGSPGGGAEGSKFIIYEASDGIRLEFRDKLEGGPDDTDRREADHLINSGERFAVHIEKTNCISSAWREFIDDIFQYAGGRATMKWR